MDIGCFVLTLMHVVRNCSAKFETGQTLSYVQTDATIPNIFDARCSLTIQPIPKELHCGVIRLLNVSKEVGFALYKTLSTFPPPKHMLLFSLDYVTTASYQAFSDPR